MNATTCAVVLAWDEPQGATSPRGWLSIESGHPDEWHRNFGVCGCRTCGWYLDYSSSREGQPAVLAKSYVFRLTGEEDFGSRWFDTIDEAKAWLAGRVRQYLTCGS